MHENRKYFIIAIIGMCMGVAGLGQLFRGQVVAGLVITIVGYILLLSIVYTYGLSIALYIALCVYCILDTRKALPMG